jgi:hypothetical protein
MPPDKLKNGCAGTFCFAILCGHFARFAVSLFVLPQRTPRARKDAQRKDMFNPANCTNTEWK